jgi:hypothetical protein
MPKTLIVCHLLLLAGLSLLVFPSAAANLAGHPAGPVTPWVAIAATVLAVVMLITEVFSGLRWLAVVAAAATVVGLIGLPQLQVSSVSVWAWGIGWVSVALWFAVLASRQRRDR